MSHLHLVPSPDAVPEADGSLLLGRPVQYFGAGRDAMTELDAEDLAAHYRRFGLRPSWRGRSDEALKLLEHVRLNGRGGAHFPVAAKWRTVLDSVRRNATAAIVIANGAEGEPLSAKDATLLELRPHLVLDGLVCAAEAVQADQAVIWLHEGASTAKASLSRALAERRRAHFDDIHIRIQLAPDHYLSGESSAAVAGVSGAAPLPQFTLLPAARRGVDGRPTLVQNVETLARVALAAREPDMEPTVLLTVAVEGRRTVLEVPAQTPLATAVHSAIGDRAIQAVLLGGYGGSWHRWADVAGLRIDEDVFRAAGLSLGAGVVLPISPTQCGLVEAARISRYLAEASARQCGPCLFGLPALATTLEDLADRRAKRRAVARLLDLSNEIAGRGACHHPDGAVSMARSAMRTFSDDVAAHLRGHCLSEVVHRGRRRRG